MVGLSRPTTQLVVVVIEPIVVAAIVVAEVADTGLEAAGAAEDPMAVASSPGFAAFAFAIVDLADPELAAGVSAVVPIVESELTVVVIVDIAIEAAATAVGPSVVASSPGSAASAFAIVEFVPHPSLLFGTDQPYACGLPLP